MQLFNAGISLKLNKMFMIDKATALHDSLLCKAVAATNQKTIDDHVFFSWVWHVPHRCQLFINKDTGVHFC